MFLLYAFNGLLKYKTCVMFFFYSKVYVFTTMYEVIPHQARLIPGLQEPLHYTRTVCGLVKPQRAHQHPWTNFIVTGHFSGPNKATGPAKYRRFDNTFCTFRRQPFGLFADKYV